MSSNPPNLEIELLRHNESDYTLIHSHNLDQEGGANLASSDYNAAYTAGNIEVINEPDTFANVALFMVKFVNGTSQAQAIGDPYIYSMRSNIPVKLPDAEACYRLYQCNNTFINAEVSVATNEHEQRMAKFVES